jgi:flagellar biosynthesis chaperone FliJ
MRIILVIIIPAVIIISGCKYNDKLTFKEEKKPAFSNVEKDSLVHNIIGAIKLINDIDDTLSVISQEIRAPKITESGNIPKFQDNIRYKLQVVTDRLRQYKSDIKSLAFVNKNYSSFISTLQKTILIREKQISDLQIQVQDLRRRLSEKERELSRTLRILQDEVAEKQKIRFNLTKEISTLSDEYDQIKYTAYYVYGTEDELEKKGLVKFKGGIFLFGLGKTPVPSSFESNSDFIKVDTRYTLELSFPSEIKSIISPQDLNYCKINGNRLKITESGKFWEGSRYLFIVTKE